MKTTATNRKIRELLTAVKNETLKINPAFQRRLVWKNMDKCSFIRTVLDGYPFPEIFVATGGVDLETGEGTELLVDGQQRVGTLYQYFNNSEHLQLGNQLPTYHDLPPDRKTQFLQYDVVVRDLGSISDEDIRRVFQRINSTSYSLNAMEIQNSRFDGDFKQTAEEIASDEFFAKNRFFNVRQIRRMDDTRFVLGYMTTVLSTYFNLDTEIEVFLEQYNEKFPQSNEIKTKSAKVFDFIECCGFVSSSRVWSQASMFTLLVETYRAMAIERLDLDPKHLVLQLQIRETPFVVALPGSGLVATAPPRPGQDETRQLVLRPYQACQQPSHLRDSHGNQFFVRAAVAPFSPPSTA